MERQTQSEAYWANLQLTDKDVENIYNALLDAMTPMSTRELARVVVEARVRSEEQRLREVLAQGKVYQPKGTYEEGDILVFPALDYAVGKVVGKRSGHNPTYGQFEVIQVHVEGEEAPREFAAALQAPHRLNQNGESSLLEQGQGLSVDEILDTYGDEILPVVAKALEERGDDFVRLDGGWFLRDSLAEVHTGHLNIAEALIDLRGEPTPVAEILAELELPEEIPLNIRHLSVEFALNQDDRFVSVSMNEERRWFLRRLLPRPLADTPPLLVYDPIPYRRDDLNISLLQIEWELDDEWSQASSAEEPASSLIPSATLVLIYPHWRFGTMPITSRVRPLIPPVEAELGYVTLIDGRWGDRFPGWVAPKQRFIAGVEEWYRKHKIPVGAYIIFERKVDEPNTYVIDYRPQRMKREWVRTARAVEGRLTFEMRKQEVACETDEHLLMGTLDVEELDALAMPAGQLPRAIQDLVADVFPELAKLSPQGTVHAKSLYSAINVIRRCPPGPIFAVLSGGDAYQDVGDGYWVEHIS